MDIPQIEILDCPGRVGNLFFKKRYPEFYEYLMKNYNKLSSGKFTERLYQYYHGLTEPPKCNCGTPCKYLNFTMGYQKFCSGKCSNNDPEVRVKKMKSNLERYGTIHPSQNPEVKKRLMDSYIKNNGGMGNAGKARKKFEETMLERYGVNTPYKNETIRAKAKASLTSQYGEVWQAHEEIRAKVNASNQKTEEEFQAINAKRRKTNLQKYGYEYTQQRPETRKQIAQSLRNNTLKKYDFVLESRADGTWVCKCPHSECNKCQEKTFEIPGQLVYGRTKNNVELCTKLLPIQPYRGEGTTLELFIRNFLDANNIQYECNVHVLGKYEADVYIPSHKLAIECNGIYWHSEVNKDLDYHYTKFKAAREAGICLVTFWEDWIINSPEKCLEILRDILKVDQEHIYGYWCNVFPVKSQETAQFLKENDITCPLLFDFSYGLYYEDELVAVMTFRKRNGVIHLDRYCHKIGKLVEGGPDILFKKFIDTYRPNRVDAYTHNDFEDGEFLERVGFKYTCMKYRPYLINDVTLDRKVYRGTMYEGYYKVYDTGQTKWMWLK